MDRPPQPTRPPARGGVLLLAALALPVCGVLLLARAVPHAKNPARYSGEYLIVGSLDDRHAQRPVPQFSPVPTPEGRVSFRDLRLRPLEFPRMAVGGMKVVYQSGRVTVKNARTGVPAWSGPPSSASFTVQTIDGVQTVKDGTGRVVWPARDAARPPPVGPTRGDAHWFGLESVPGSVTVEDTRGRALGRVPIQMLAVHESIGPMGGPIMPVDPFQYRTQDGALTAPGTLLLTYRTATGLIVRRSRVFRAAGGRGGHIG